MSNHDNWKLRAPVALMVFKRPDVTRRVFEQIRAIQPTKLLVIADGHRPDRVGEIDKCTQTRKIIDEGVDWNCEVIKNYSDVNMGCKQRVSSGIKWVFEQVEEAIILEDDCLPHPTFFRFCDELLDKYRHDDRVATICGTNVVGEWKADIQNYHFSYYGGIWGWASWRRAWNDYDVEMKLWGEPEAQARVKDVLCDKKQYLNRKAVFDRMYAGQIDSWDHQWSFARLLHSRLAVVPSRNLISNIGFSDEATHTNNYIKGVSELSLQEMKFPLKEPYGFAVDRGYDLQYYQKIFNRKRTLKMRVTNKLNKILSNNKKTV